MAEDGNGSADVAIPSERAVLLASLARMRQAVVAKAEGLSRPDAVAAGVDSGTSVAGVVNHLAHVERWWFRHVFAGEDHTFPWSDDDPDAEWRIDDDDDVADVLERYREERHAADEIIAHAHLEDVAARHGRRGPLTLRWIVVHAIEETARHAGHADILRERIDGVVGD